MSERPYFFLNIVFCKISSISNAGPPCAAGPARRPGAAHPPPWLLFVPSRGFQTPRHNLYTKSTHPSNYSFRLNGNIYDDWAQDLLSTKQSPYSYDELKMEYCDEEAIEQCLEEFMNSDYGKTMFGRHDLPASVG